VPAGVRRSAAGRSGGAPRGVSETGAEDGCPSCGAAWHVRTVVWTRHPDRPRGSEPVPLRRCGSCRRLAERADDPDGWVDAGLHPDFHGYFDWEPEPLPPSWEVLPVDRRAAWEAELAVEVAEGHPLFGHTTVAIARCVDCGEAVFCVVTSDHRFVRVGLTWSGATEQPPAPHAEFPSSTLPRSLAGHHH
jgi:hypothetical protein